MVPEKLDRIAWLRETKDITQVLFQIAVAADGDVVPCCVIAESDVIRMGNLFEEDFSVIWNSEAYRRFRHRIRTHDLHDFCKNCYLD